MSSSEDDDLHTLWANLLVNAADPSTADRIRAAFIDISKQLSRREALLLDSIQRAVMEQMMATANSVLPDEPSPVYLSGASCKNFPVGNIQSILRHYVDLGLTHMRVQELPSQGNYLERPDAAYERSQFEASVDNLLRLRLIEPEHSSNYERRQGIENVLGSLSSDDYLLTALGFEFIAACQRPDEYIVLEGEALESI